MRNQQNNRQTCQNTSKVWRLNALAAAMAVAMGGFSAGAFAAAPAANSTIGNTATATYTDASAVPRSATSNTVQTIVQQVGSFTLTADATRYVAPGGQVVFPHTLTNTGNGSDTFNLSAANNAAGDDFEFAAFTIYADADGNGVPDNATAITSVSLAAGGVYKFVVVTNAPVTATNAQEGDFTVTANTSSVFTPVLAQTVTNADTAIISTNAVVSVTKSANITTGPAGTVVTYTLTYTNTGNTAATNFVLTDTLPANASPGTIGTMRYQANTGVWSGGGSLTDDIAGTPNEGTANTSDGTGITYQVMGTPLLGTERVVATIASVAANSSGTVSFQVKIDDSTADGNSIARAGVLSNKALFDYNNGAANVTGQQTNIVDFTVTPTASVVANNATSSTADGGVNDIVAPNEAIVNQGSVVSFNNWIHNTGNSADTFNVTYSNGDTGFANVFPAGTSFQLYQADGVNVLQDTNSDGIPDTGSLPVGGEYKVVLKATLPAGYSGTVNYNVTKIARSVTDPTKSNTVTDQLTTIIANVADLSNNLATGYADGTLGGGAATTTGTLLILLIM
ncbi:MAG: DUF11 domain-containing protein [Moraxellaceae bacterium]|nr:DUF11 domain-containing protein [Moraxellaceae bacterium]